MSKAPGYSREPTVLGGTGLRNGRGWRRGHGGEHRAAPRPEECGPPNDAEDLLMAALAAAIGLLPASIATGIGSETQKPLARVVVGGMVTSAVLILLVLPAMYLIVHRYAERRATVREPMEAEPASE